MLEGSQNETLTSNEIKSIRAAVKTISKWDSIKKNGKTGIPAGDATAAFDRLDNVLREHGIFLVPVGELENFIRDVGEHGPSWVNNVLERHPELGDGAYDQITEFIRNMNL